MEFFDRLAEINKTGWYMLNCFQLAGMFQVNLQFRQPNGAYTEYFSGYAHHEDPVTALESAFKNAQATKAPTQKAGGQSAQTPKVRQQTAFTTDQERRLQKAVYETFFAMKRNGARSRDRTSDM